MSNQVQDLIWNEDYKIGNEKVDTQHHQLFEMANKLILSCSSECDTQKLRDSLSFLVNYTVHHFNDEEALQRGCGYPHYEEHKQIHEDFKSTMGRLVQGFWESGSADELKNDLIRVLVVWIQNHVTRDDKRIGEYIRGSTG